MVLKILAHEVTRFVTFVKLKHMGWCYSLTLRSNAFSHFSVYFVDRDKDEDVSFALQMWCLLNSHALIGIPLGENGILEQKGGS